MAEIDIQEVANKVAGQPVIFEGERINITKNVNLYRFAFADAPEDFGRMHMLVDACGGYKAIFNPGTPYAEVAAEGSLMDFKKPQGLSPKFGM